MFKENIHNFFAIIILILITKGTVAQKSNEHFVVDSAQKAKIEIYFKNAKYQRFESHFEFVPFKDYEVYKDTSVKRWIIPFEFLLSPAIMKTVETGKAHADFNAIFLTAPIIDTKRKKVLDK